MTITKRILTVLLMAALIVSCMLLSVSADDEKFRADGIEDIEDIMEYYDLEDFVADNYELGTWDKEYYTGSKSTIVADPTNPDNKVFAVTDINNKYEKSSETDRLVVSYNIYFGSTMTAQHNLDVKTFDAAGNESVTFNTIFSSNLKKGTFQYSVWDENLNNGAGGFVLMDFADIAPEKDVWYSIVIFFNASEGSYNFKISADGGENWTYSSIYSLGNVVKMSKFQLSTKRNTRSEKVNLYLDNVEIYCGTFERNPSNKIYYKH